MTSPDLSGDFDPLTAPRKFTGVWIPREIYLCKDINALEKMLWAEIHYLDSDEYGGCYASEKYLTEFLGIKRRQLYEMLKHLKDLGLIEDVKSNGRQKFRKAILPKVVKEKPEQQTCGKPHITSAENRTYPIIYKRKNIDNIEQTEAPAVAKCDDEVPYFSPKLAAKDVKAGTLKFPQDKLKDLITQYGEERVEMNKKALSEYVVQVPNYKYKKAHYLGLENFIKRSIQREEEQKAKDSRENKVNWKNPSEIGNTKFRPKNLLEE